MLRNHVGVALDDAAGNADVLRICAVVEQKILAEILLVALAEIAFLARRRVGGDYALSQLKSGDIFPGLDYIAGQLMPEHRRWNDHARVVAAAEHLDVGAA